MEQIDDEILQDLYTWVDHIPLSRPKRNMARDFSDGVMCAEVILHHFPKLVELHNYVPASASKQKEDNWRLLNRKVLRRLNMELSEDVIRSLAASRPYTIERVLLILRSKIDRTIFEKHRNEQASKMQYSDRPEVDQHTSSRPKGLGPGRTKPAGKPTPSVERTPQAQITRNRVRSRSTSPFYPPQNKPVSTPKREQNRPAPKQAPPRSIPPRPAPRSNPLPRRIASNQTLSRVQKNENIVTTKPAIQKSPSIQPIKVMKPPPQAGDISIPVPQWPRANITAREAKEFTSDYTSRLAYEEKAQECLAKDETIEILNAKVRRLEHLVHLKDIRIEDLQARLEELRPTNKRH